jgi:hypothetical protein
MRTLIEMAHEVYGEHTFWTEAQLLRLKELERLVRADERERLKASIALDWMAKNARELGLDYETPPKAQTEAEKTAYAFGWCKAMEYARQNGVITSQPVPVKTYHDGKPWPVAPKPWVGLTDEERLTEAERHLGEMHVENCGLNNIKDFAQAIEAKLKEKNHDTKHNPI